MDVRDVLLITAFRHRISEPNIDLGFERFLTLAGQPIAYDAFCDAVATCLRDRLIREPIRLPEGALQCHWHLELTPGGVLAARHMISDGSGWEEFSKVCGVPRVPR
jgi:hypothetical protein